MNNVVHLIFSLEIGGAENLVIDIVNEQVKQVKVIFIIINDKINKELFSRIDNKVTTICLNRKEGSKIDFSFLAKLWYYLFKYKPDSIHCHNHNIANLLLPRFKKKAHITVHDVGDPVQNLKHYRKVFSISNAVYNDLHRQSITSDIVFNGIHFEDFTCKKNYPAAENRSYQLVQVSRLVHQKKGQDLLLKALHVVLNNYQLHNVSLAIIGEGQSEDFLKKLTIDLNLENNVCFPGAKNREWLKENLCNYDVLVQPSRFEGFGLTVLEGLAAGLPVIASNIDGPAEILKEVPAAFLFESEDVAALAKTIVAVINLYRNNELQTRCNASLALMQEQYSIKKSAQNYLESYVA